ncbi:MAG: ABC transporter permease [Acidimicrobiia bacterium]|nr:ABC transporter permease [Acidimicrobiia bacterium]
MRKVFAIGKTSVVRLMRDRLNLFFVFVLPTMLIVVIGVVFGSGITPRLGILSAGDGEFETEIVEELMAVGVFETTLLTDRAEVVQAVERGELELGVVIPEAFDDTIAAGVAAEIEYLARPSGSGFEVQAIVQGIIDDQAARIRAGRFLVEEGLAPDLAAALAVVDAASVGVAEVEVELDSTGPMATVGAFDLGAAQNLVLFMFVTSLAASAALILSRKLGVSKRMLSTPTSATTVVAGETLGRFLVALTQGLFIAVVAALAFGVDWGYLPAALAVIVAFAAVGTGAAMLIGSTFSNDEQAGGIGTFLGLGLGALGGCMVPLEIFSPTMRQVAHVTPHAWALDAFSELIREDAGFGDILNELAVLVGFATVLILLAAWRFRRSITA